MMDIQGWLQEKRLDLMARRAQGDTESGYTLVELMVCILIIGVLFAVGSIVAMTSVKGTQEKSNGEPIAEPSTVPEPTPVAPGPSVGEFLTPILTVVGSVVGIVTALGLMVGMFMFFRQKHLQRQAVKKTFVGRKALMDDLEYRFNETVQAIAKYETDPMLAIDYPAFNDITVPEVSSMIKAMSVAKNARMTITSSYDDVGPYREAVAEFEVTFLAAKRSAERIAWSTIPEAEQKDLRTAKELLKQVSDPGNTEEARDLYRARLLTVVSRINRVHGTELIPTKIVAELEASTMLELTQ